MSLGNNKGPVDGKGSNYNWQLRMLQIANKCCTPVVTELERTAIVSPPVGKMVYQTDTAGIPGGPGEGLWLYKSTGWVKVNTTP